MKTVIGIVIGFVLLCALNLTYADSIDNQLNEIKNAQQEQATATSRAQASDHLQQQIDRLNNAGN